MEILEKYGLLTFLLIYFFKDILPMIINAVSKIAERIIPARAQLQRAQSKHMIEMEERKIDLQERQVIAWEQIGKSQILTEERLRQILDQLALMSAALTNANAALAIILDRVGRRSSDTRTRNMDAEP